MDALYLLIPLSLLFILGIGAAFWWAIFSGQFDESDAAAKSILQDDELPARAAPQHRPPAAQAGEGAAGSVDD